jgi:hypothetical protein
MGRDRLRDRATRWNLRHRERSAYRRPPGLFVARTLGRQTLGRRRGVHDGLARRDGVAPLRANRPGAAPRDHLSVAPDRERTVAHDHVASIEMDATPSRWPNGSDGRRLQTNKRFVSPSTSETLGLWLEQNEGAPWPLPQSGYCRSGEAMPKRRRERVMPHGQPAARPDRPRNPNIRKFRLQVI